MKQRILGLDVGTNSLGWAVVDYDAERAEEEQYTPVDAGVHVFEEGVKMEKGNEASRAAERTGHRRLRIGYWRRKCRKIALLRVLMKYDLCPALTHEALKEWQQKKVYPLSEAFMLWQRTDEATHKNPYYYRHLCLTQPLDLSQQKNRRLLGRALYHLNQRRGFLSNRKEEGKNGDGTVLTAIGDLTAAMQERGIEYLGEYFYTLYEEKEKIRKHYTHRLDHYEKELLRICEVQQIDKVLGEGLTAELRHRIITQRPLRSQKHTVGQ